MSTEGFRRPWLDLGGAITIRAQVTALEHARKVDGVGEEAVAELSQLQ